ncbi:cache domain-containing protein [Mycobacterium sp. URHB0044]|jgi:hypothetical protein|uniref:cache domain-containing protein n=1 Tax=Mycobacterium sp. URHB0044 TaxID=1380386 RepID=UPI00068466D2|nr:cache domain-containing protein [Mycobacterium sp. URHB0044]
MSHPHETRAVELEHVQAAVTALVEDVFDSLRTVASAATSLWDRLESEGTAPRSTDLSVLRDVINGELRRQGEMFNGAGVVVADGVLADSPRYLEWWRPDVKHGGPAQKLSLDLNPQSEYFYDYTTMDWFARPRDQGTRWIDGPYLDYTGVDLYVCTFAVPVASSHGVFLGVAAADVPVARLDAVLLPTFTAGSGALALANAEGRVIIANHPDHVTGCKIRDGALGPPRPVPATPWSLVPLK